MFSLSIDVSNFDETSQKIESKSGTIGVVHVQVLSMDKPPLHVKVPTIYNF